MGKTAFLFPGQGAQAVGMGEALREAGSDTAAYFNQADETLGFALSDLMKDGPADQLTLTENAQPALVTCSMAAYHLLTSQTDLRPDYVAGHSLGEYAAICAAGGFSFADAVQLVRLRGQAMQAAVPPGEGSMAAMLNMDPADVEAVCKEAAEATGGVCVPANFNTSAQIVISGGAGPVDKAIELAKVRGAKRCMKLEVSAPFHSPMMQPAAEAMQKALAGCEMSDLTTPLVANVVAREVIAADEMRKLLVDQVTGAVRWEASMRYLIDQGVETFVEIGAGRVLAGMMRRIDRKAKVFVVNGPADLEKLPN
ncbi:MAG: ACP S-malonyltransferase [Magnetococcales bacterium]|nr:ACP S-malonyltransferase [Magnetococcales bacterium]